MYALETVSMYALETLFPCTLSKHCFQSPSKKSPEYCLHAGYRTFETIMFLEGLVFIRFFTAPSVV